MRAAIIDVFEHLIRKLRYSQKNFKSKSQKEFIQKKTFSLEANMTTLGIQVLNINILQS